MSAPTADTPKASDYRTLSTPRLRVAALADAQWGVVALRQLADLAVPASTVRNWVATGRLLPLHQGVYAVGHRRLRAEGHRMAAVLACGPTAFLSHRSAAAHWGLVESGATRLDVTLPSQAGRGRTGIRVHCRELPPPETTVRDGIPCTTVPRTLLDLAGLAPGRPLERACEQAEREGLFDPWAVAELLVRNRRRRGVARLRAVLAEWDSDLSRTRSELEILFLRAVLRAGLPRPLVNSRLELPGGAVEIDFLWPAERLIVETDGAAFHGSPIARRADAARDKLLREAGWRVIRLTYADVKHHCERSILTVRRALHSRNVETVR